MDEKGFDYMNVVPLVDVMLVLLAIVLMTSTFIASGMIPVELPRAANDQKGVLKTATIVIDRQATIYFESVPTTLDALHEKIRKLDRQTPVLIKADRYVMVQACVDVLDLLSENSFRKVALQTERSPRQASPKANRL